MVNTLPTLFVPGLNCSARLYTPLVPALWRLGPIAIADHTREETMQGIAASILAAAPAQFRLVGLSMGGYLAFEIVRQAPERVAKLALLGTSARADTPEQTERRRGLIRLAEDGRFREVNDVLWPILVHESRQGHRALRVIVDAMAEETGPEAFIRQQRALIGRPDSRRDLARIRCPILVAVGDRDLLTPPELSQEIADGIRGARLETIATCGHLSTLERPEVVTRLLVEFFGS
jgi:pimeloyl-ACP methyl ester carboxylesterase